jgi:uncharacterized membrane protein YkvA (DUF1232 family)
VRLLFLRRLAILVPRYGKLMYCLYRDPRVPRSHKVAFAAALAAIFGPWDLPLFIPIVGEMEAPALTALAVKVFVDRAPKEVVREHEELIRANESVVDRVLRRVRHAAAERGSVWLRQSWIRVGAGLAEVGREARDRVDELAARRRARPLQ